MAGHDGVYASMAAKKIAKGTKLAKRASQVICNIIKVTWNIL